MTTIDYSRAILYPTNEDVDMINDKVLQTFPAGETQTYLSADSISDPGQTYLCPTEFLNSLTPAGLPPHKLCLRVSTPIILLRNLDPRNGLLNGTRLRIISLGSRLIEAKIMTGKKTGKYVFIPRITLTPSVSGLPFDLRRHQFPIRPAYVMTINKSQGQTHFRGHSSNQSCLLTRSVGCGIIACAIDGVYQNTATTESTQRRLLLHG